MLKSFGRYYRLLCLLICTLLLLSLEACSNNYKSADTDKQYFEIYLVDNMKPVEAMQMDLDKIPIEKAPVITNKDIDKYIWNTHEFILKKDISYKDIPTYGKAFVLIVENKRIYMGTFWNLLSSISTPELPVINVPPTKDKIYEIEYYGKHNDPRNNSDLYDALRRNGMIVEK